MERPAAAAAAVNVHTPVKARNEPHHGLSWSQSVEMNYEIKSQEVRTKRSSGGLFGRLACIPMRCIRNFLGMF